MVKNNYSSGRNDDRLNNPNGQNVTQAFAEEGDEELPKQADVIPCHPYAAVGLMNLNAMLVENIRSHDYFKGLEEHTTFEQVVDQIYYDCKVVSLWQPGTHKVKSASGMCSGLRGVSNAGVPSACAMLLFKLYILQLTTSQVKRLITHPDSPYIRAVGFLYLRHVVDPKTLFAWCEPHLHDQEKFSVLGDGFAIPVGRFVTQLLTQQEFHDVMLPRLPVPVKREIDAKLNEMGLGEGRGGGGGGGGGDDRRAGGDDRGRDDYSTREYRDLDAPGARPPERRPYDDRGRDDRGRDDRRDDFRRDDRRDDRRGYDDRRDDRRRDDFRRDDRRDDFRRDDRGRDDRRYDDRRDDRGPPPRPAYDRRDDDRGREWRQPPPQQQYDERQQSRGEYAARREEAARESENPALAAYERGRRPDQQEAPEAKRARADEPPAETAAEKLARLRARQAALLGGGGLASRSIGGDYAGGSGGASAAKGLQRYQQLVRGQR